MILNILYMLLKTNVCVKPCKPIKNTNILSYIEIMYLYLCCAQNYLTEKYQVMKHSTLNTQHSTLNTQHSTLNRFIKN